MNQDITPPANQTPVVNSTTEPTPDTAPSSEAAPQVIQPQHGPRKSKAKGILLTLMVLLLLAAAAGGAYYYQQGKLNTLGAAKTAADSQVASLQSRLKVALASATAAKPTPAPVVNYNAVTGTVTTQAATTASISALYKPTTVDELWVEYGTAPDKLTSASTHLTQGLTAGDANSYAQQTFKLTGLTAGQNYFYHVAAKSKGNTFYGGTAAFTATK